MLNLLKYDFLRIEDRENEKNSSKRMSTVFYRISESTNFDVKFRCSNKNYKSTKKFFNYISKKV